MTLTVWDVLAVSFGMALASVVLGTALLLGQRLYGHIAVMRRRREWMNGKDSPK